MSVEVQVLRRGVLTLRFSVKFSFVWYWVCEMFNGFSIVFQFLTTVGEFCSSCISCFSNVAMTLRRL